MKRGEDTLPIGQVPNLLPGDRLWIHPDFPESQSAHYVLIVGFLRGATNPPPSEWFTHVETWTKKVRQRGCICHGSSGGAAGGCVSGAFDGRGFQHAAECGSRAAWSVCTGGSGPEFCERGQDAAGHVSGRGQGHVADRSQIIEGTGAEGGGDAGNPGGAAVLRQAVGPAGSLSDAAHGRHGAGRCRTCRTGCRS